VVTVPEGRSSGDNLALFGGNKAIFRTTIIQFRLDAVAGFLGVGGIDLNADR
jgi:hypothetical protein